MASSSTSSSSSSSSTFPLCSSFYDPPPPFPSDLLPTSLLPPSTPHLLTTTTLTSDTKSSFHCSFSSPFPLSVLNQFSLFFAELDALSLGTLAYHQLMLCVDQCLRYLHSNFAVTYCMPSQFEMDQVLFDSKQDRRYCRDELRYTFEQVHQILCYCLEKSRTTPSPPSILDLYTSSPHSSQVPPTSLSPHVLLPMPSSSFSAPFPPPPSSPPLITTKTTSCSSSPRYVRTPLVMSLLPPPALPPSTTVLATHTTDLDSTTNTTTTATTATPLTSPSSASRTMSPTSSPTSSTLFPSTTPKPSSTLSLCSPTRLKKQRYSVFLSLVLLLHLAVLIGMLSWQRGVTSFTKNPMVGPDPTTLIRFGAHFVPCMRWTPSFLNDVARLQSVCGWNGFVTGHPDQFFRFITAIFLPSGVIPFVLELGLVLSIGLSLEQKWGWKSVSFVYILSGICGLLLSSLFNPIAIKTGLLASLSGLIGLFYLDKWLFPSVSTASKGLFTSSPTFTSSSSSSSSLVSVGKALALAFTFVTLFMLDRVHTLTGFFSGCILGISITSTLHFFLRVCCFCFWCVVGMVSLWMVFGLPSEYTCFWCHWIGEMSVLEMGSTTV